MSWYTPPLTSTSYSNQDKYDSAVFNTESKASGDNNAVFDIFLSYHITMSAATNLLLFNHTDNSISCECISRRSEEKPRHDDWNNSVG
jgi:hypothetical protein